MPNPHQYKLDIRTDAIEVRRNAARNLRQLALRTDCPQYAIALCREADALDHLADLAAEVTTWG